MSSGASSGGDIALGEREGGPKTMGLRLVGVGGVKVYSSTGVCRRVRNDVLEGCWEVEMF